MDLCDGGELFDRIKAQPAGSYSEKDAQQVLRQICIGLSYLHRFRIAHCDLKPDNFLFSGGATDTLKIIDFGMSKWVKRRQYFHSLRGTPYYIAPEVIKGQYNESCDVRRHTTRARTQETRSARSRHGGSARDIIVSDREQLEFVCSSHPFSH